MTNGEHTTLHMTGENHPLYGKGYKRMGEKNPMYGEKSIKRN